MDPFTRIEDAQRFLEQRVYDHFRETGEWPRARDLDLEFADVLDRLGGLQVICQRIGADRIVCGSPTSEHDRVMVKVPALADCGGAEEDIANFLAAVRLVAKRYHEKRGVDVTVTMEDVAKSLNLSEGPARRVVKLMSMADGLVQSAGGSTITPAHLVSRMRGVSSLQDYLAQVAANADRGMMLAELGVRPPRPAPKAPRHLFLSHAADDGSLAHYLADVLRQGSPQVEVFVASKAGDIPTGSDWLAVIEAELRRTDAYVLLLTPFSVKRFWLWYESGAAWMSGRLLIPVTAAGLAKSDVPYPLGARQSLSLEDPADVAQFGRDLGAAIPDAQRFCDAITELCRRLPWQLPVPQRQEVIIRVAMHRNPDRIVLTNVGTAAARQVNLVLEEPNNPILETERAAKLPIPLLEPGQNWSLLIAVSRDHVPPYHGVVECVDPDGQKHAREVHIGGWET